MSALLRIAGIGVLIGALVVASLQMPPFPPQFGYFLTVGLKYLFAIDPFIPVKLAFNLLLALWLIDAIILGMRGLVWLYRLVMGLETS